MLVVKFSRFGLGLNPQHAWMVVVVVVLVVVVVVGACVVVVGACVVVVGACVVVVGACVVVVEAGVVVVVDAAQGFILQEPGPMDVPPTRVQWSSVNCPHSSWPLSSGMQQRTLF